MAKSGDVLEHPVTREKLVIRQSASETNGALLQADFYLPSGGFVAAEHVHPRQTEHFAVVSGTLRGRVGGKEVSCSQGESLTVAPGTPHVWWNAGESEMHVLVELRPALRMEHFFETFFGLAQEGKVNQKTGLPNLLQMAVIMRAYQNELILARPPQAVQAVLFGLLAPLGRVLGYQADHLYPHQQPPPVRPQTT